MILRIEMDLNAMPRPPVESELCALAKQAICGAGMQGGGSKLIYQGGKIVGRYLFVDSFSLPDKPQRK